ncbi:MAG TPA: ABC transporter ATP-binding protein [Beijerinckiaceae bacterium]|nr:ABC transporter ATP-binding protein [Rhodoblastus sp.]HRY02448.1 ABC transporter ATP-binding protein [Beijerinckiaceae bacterium]
MSAPLLSLENVGHAFGGFTVLREVALDVPKGEIVGLIGPNGSGKTTLFNIISGYVRHRSGRIVYDGVEMRNQTIQQRSYAGMVRTFQTPMVFEKMTVLENVMVGCNKITSSGMVEGLLSLPRARKEAKAMREQAEMYCEKFSLSSVAHQLAHNLSAGQRRILEIARAVVGKPNLLLLDEPSSGLNPDEIDELDRSIRALNDAGLTILLVSHDMDLMSVARRVHVLYFGRIIASGSMEEIQANPEVREAYFGS